jgi:16S rRNA (adenine1518-N6/adenine1519-N6)-dimethyltransferase
MASHIPRKRFGQHFLVDGQVIADIVSVIGPQRGDKLIEIGPGLAAITEPLYARVDHLHVVEIDRDIIAKLKKRFDPARLSIHEGDALAFDFGALADPAADRPSLRIVGNLPYNISTPILFHLANFAEQTLDMHFMLQKEVVDRMVAEPGGGDYSRLSVMLQFRFHMESLLDVPPEAFDPPPKVDSAVVRMIPKAASELPDVDTACFEKVVATAFSQRRKMLRNTLRELFPDNVSALLESLGIAPTARAEELPGEAFVRLANAFQATLAAAK